MSKNHTSYCTLICCIGSLNILGVFSVNSLQMSSSTCQDFLINMSPMFKKRMTNKNVIYLQLILSNYLIYNSCSYRNFGNIFIYLIK